jgi:hypothetical protein
MIVGNDEAGRIIQAEKTKDISRMSCTKTNRASKEHLFTNNLQA